jgi:hypothetical protein
MPTYRKYATLLQHAGDSRMHANQKFNELSVTFEFRELLLTLFSVMENSLSPRERILQQ